MKNIVLTFLSAFVITGFCNAAKPAVYSPEIDPYVKFIQQCDTDPVDYVMGLFEKYDIVILGERDHRDTTQYDLIKRIISDQRFIDNVGHVITEVGANNMSANANRIINADMTDDEFYDAFVKHLRNVDMDIYWEKFNFYQLHRDIREVNKNLTPDKKLDITYSGPSFLWDSNQMSREEYLKSYNYLDSQFDNILAENAINRFCEILQNSHRKKALIIYNRPHSYKYYETKTQSSFAGQIIMDRLPQRVANVMINWCRFDFPMGGQITINPIQEGKWDASFKNCNNKSIGFDFADSPFGRDTFDHYSTPVELTTYADIYTGFIFYKPIEEWVFTIDYKGFVDDEFVDEFCRRNVLIGDSEENAKLYTEFMKNQETWSFQFREDLLLPYEKQVNKFIIKPGTEKGK